MPTRARTTFASFRTLIAVLAFTLVATGLGACASPAEQALRGPVWALTATTSTLPAFQGVIPPAERLQYTIQFAPAGRWTGQADCNQVAGSYTTTRREGLEIMLGPSTMMACPEGSIAQLYLIALSNTVGFDATNARLTLRLDGGGTLEFVASDFIAAPESPDASAEASGEPSAEPTPVATATPKPTAKPTPSPSPTPKPTPKPTATPAATPKPTATPAPTAAPPATATCASADGTITVTYPGAWFTVSDVPEYQCMAFDPAPIVIDPNTGIPIASVYVVASNAVTYDEALMAATDTRTWTGVTKAAVTVSGLPGMKVSGTANGTGSYPAGTYRYAYYVDRGTDGVVVIQTTGAEGNPDITTNEQVVDQMAGRIVIK